MAEYQFVMKGLTKVVPPNKEILKDIWLSFLPGAKIGVIGPNGAGKTTLFRMITGDEQPDAGSIELGESVQLSPEGLPPITGVVDPGVYVLECKYHLPGMVGEITVVA
jgi:ABC-type multidrug transport system ATPase subunit